MHVLGQQPVRPDGDVNHPVADAFRGFLQLLAVAEPGQQLDLDWERGEALAEGVVVLLCEDGSGHQDRHLLAVRDRFERGRVLVGFALETNDEEKNAIDKLQRKNLDFIVLNSLNDEGAGFKTDTNKITIIDKAGNVVKFDLKTKVEVAADIVDYTYKTLAEK